MWRSSALTKRGLFQTMCKFISTTLFLTLLCSSSIAGEVTFTNKTGGALMCWRQSGSDYLQFLKLTDGETRTFPDFSMPTKVNCNTDTSHIYKKPSSTLLTHFTVTSYGEYVSVRQTHLPFASRKLPQNRDRT